jgi:DNA mismatch repair protein MutS
MKLMEIYFKEYNAHVAQYGKDKSLLFMQVGSFYEAYESDTEGYTLDVLSDLMNCMISKRDKHQPVSKDNVRMLGFPLQSLQKYISILTDDGYQVKVLDQNGTSKTETKITRQVKAVYSRGTMIDLDDKNNNHILSLYLDKDDTNLDIIGITICDIGTGVLEIKDCLCDPKDMYQALDEISRYIITYNPSEIILGGDKNCSWTNSKIKYLDLEDKKYYILDTKDKLYHKINYQTHELSKICKQKSPIEYLDIEQYHYGRISLMMLLEYIEHHNPDLLKNISQIQNYSNSSFLYLGNNATQQLNVLSSDQIQNKIGNKYKSLYDVINFTLTPMGRRLLKRELCHPLVDVKKIKERYELVQNMREHLDTVKEDMQYISDIEKMYKKLQLGDLSPFELYKWIISIQRISFIHKKLNKIYPLNNEKSTEIYTVLNSTFSIDKLPLYSLQHNGNINENIFLPNINKELDKIQQKIDENRELLKSIANYIEEYSISESSKKNPNCRVEFNERDGYHLITTKKRWKEIELSIRQQGLLFTKINSGDFIGKDNSVSGTKIFSDQLKKLSDELIKNEHQISSLVQEEYKKYCIQFSEKYKQDIIKIIDWISCVDFFYSGAMCIEKYHYTIPDIQEDTKSWFTCEKIRHPIVERISDNYIPFDIELGIDYNGITLFGLNSAGKSTLQKSVGLNIILAQMGYPVACVKLQFSPYHSLFTRISGNDNLFKGLSSFSIEMLEIRNILKRTNNRSLIIADEVCRGTEYESGLIIVLTMIKLLDQKRANFITASHLHEIVKHKVYQEIKNVKSFHIKISYDETTNVITYNRELHSGSGDNFYGLLVSKSLIDDREFIQISNEIKESIVSTKKDVSKYNKHLIKDECCICKKQVKDGEISLETHHIIFQKDAVNNMINEYQHKNSNSNLVVICQKCHDDVDRGKINIKRKVETSVGDKLILENKDEIILESTNNSGVEKKVIELNMKKFSQKMIKEKLSQDNINLSINKISKIIANGKIL